MSFKPRILVLENDAPTRAMVEATLTRMDTIPNGFDTAAAGLEALEHEKFDGAFVDWDNLDLSGVELVRRVRHSPSNVQIPIAMFTASTDTRVIADAFKAGVTLFLSKPFGARELERLLNTCRGTMLEERRRYQRVVLSVPIVCEWGKKRGFRRITGRTVNVSNSGMLMRLHPQPETGTAVVSELILPNSRQPLKLDGTVVRAGANRQVAVQFAHLTPAQRDLLEDYIGSPETEVVTSGWMKA
ncbi:MAG TPA: response regulator, partial [Terriglobia bacterium]|nr:response regulator [Terriglobia bacterium]